MKLLTAISIPLLLAAPLSGAAPQELAPVPGHHKAPVEPDKAAVHTNKQPGGAVRHDRLDADEGMEQRGVEPVANRPCNPARRAS